MNDNDATQKLLTEIRDLLQAGRDDASREIAANREDVARTIANQELSLARQQQALSAQRVNALVYRIVVGVALTILSAMLVLFSRL